jgi:hypothetical protein
MRPAVDGDGRGRLGLAGQGCYSSGKEAAGTARFSGVWGGAVQNYNNVPYDFLKNGDRRKADRRREQLDRRGILRWDPQMKDRRLMSDRRAGLSGTTRR